MRLSKTLLITMMISGLLNINSFTEAKPVKKVSPKKPALTAKVEKNYTQIDKLIEYEYYSKADNLLNNMLFQNPNDETARAMQIISMAKQGKLDIAQTSLNKLLPKSSKNANLHYAQGVINLKRQSSSDMNYRKNSEELIKDAIKEFQTSIKLNPQHYQAYNALGVIALNMGDFDAAKIYFNQSLNISPNFATAIDNLGTIDYLEGKYNVAQSQFDKALTLNPNSATAYFHQAQVYDKKSLYSKALDSLDNAIRLNPTLSMAYNLRGEILKKQGNETAAIESFKKSIAIKPENTKPYLNLAKIYENRFDNELSIANLKSALSINPSLNNVKLQIADISLLNGNYKEALKYYSSLLGIEGYNTDALKGMANAYFEQAKHTANDNITLRNRELKTAYKDIEKALIANPHDLHLYLAKLKIAKITGQEKVTQETLDAILNSPTRGLNDLLAKGDAYYSMNKYREAKETYEKSVVYAQNLDDYLFVAEILTYNKFYPSAKDILRKSLVIDPSNEEAIQNLNYIMEIERKSESLYKDAKFFQKKDKNRVFAREYALRSLELNPTNFQSALLSAKLCEKQKHYQEAVNAYKVVSGLEVKPRKIKRYNRKIKRLEKKINRLDKRYMKSEAKEFKKCQNKLMQNL